MVLALLFDAFLVYFQMLHGVGRAKADVGVICIDSENVLVTGCLLIRHPVFIQLVKVVVPPCLAHEADNLKFLRSCCILTAFVA